MPARVVILPVREFVSRELKAPPFIVEPYVPMGGIVFLYGKAGIGKTPLSWEVAACVATNRSFLGRPTRRASVLYVDVDTPEAQIVARMRELPNLPESGWTMAWAQPFNVLSSIDPVTKELTAYGHNHQPEFVVLNTLRKMYRGDDRESWLPSQVYGAFHGMFPGAAIWVNHHDKKTGDPTIPRNEDEDFAGSQAWINDATTGLHLMQQKGDPSLLHLKHTKSQVSAKAPPLTMRLDPDGHTLHVYDFEAEVYRLYQSLDPALTYGDRVKLVCEGVGKGRTMVTEALARAKARFSPVT